jgi:hypothetical protein
MPLETMQESTGSATQFINTENLEASLQPVNPAEVLEIEDIKTPRLDHLKELTIKEETKSHF